MQKKLRPYIPDFKLAFEHFCIHTGEAITTTQLLRAALDDCSKRCDPLHP